VHDAKFGEFERQVPATAQGVIENLDMTRTVHRFNRVFAILRLRCEDHVMKFIPMTRALPQRSIKHLRRVHLLIAGRLAFVADVALYHLV
jgi:hypothetical protein